MDDEWRASQSRTREERGKVNEEEKGEDADDTKPIFRVHLEEQEMRRDMEVKKIIVKTRTTGSGSRMTRSRSRTARSRSIEHRRYAVPRGS
ncbi:Actinorhodin polyketide synthase bifunctional cyclase/dehydratase [Trichinella pseudospiralis]